jgi:hypothetical protein
LDKPNYADLGAQASRRRVSRRSLSIHSPPGRQRSQDGDRIIAEYAREIWNAEPFLTE